MSVSSNDDNPFAPPNATQSDAGASEFLCPKCGLTMEYGCLVDTGGI